MDLLIAESLEPDVVGWLESRHSVRYAPQLASDPRGFRQGLAEVRALIVPSSLALDAQTLQQAPLLRAIGRVSAGAENIDLEACARAGVEVVRSLTASAQAEAEFMIHALLSLLRRFPVVGPDGSLAGRELSSCTVGLIGMQPAARSMAQMLSGFEARLVGYEPTLHPTEDVWERWHVKPLGLRELLQEADAVCVQLPYFSRYRGLLGERFLPFCKPDQVIVSISHSALFDEACLADALATDRLAAVWLDSVEPGALEPGRPLYGIETLQVSPRVASTTRESHQRSAWAVAKRIDELIRIEPPSGLEPLA
jgi:phosphoglycerate dehydrogenase-like enzyme